jgi:hypothetical protein
MTNTLRDLLAQAEAWPREDQEELAEYARQIGARRTGVYRMSEMSGPPWARVWLKRIKASSYPTIW